MSRRKTWPGRIFLGRENGRQRFYWVGRFATKRERDAAVAKARTERPWEARPAVVITCDEWADRYLDRYERLVERGKRKASSLSTVRLSLKAFRATFGPRAIGAVEPVEAEDWIHTVPASQVPQVVVLFNYAKRMRVIDRNPFEGLGGVRKSRGRADARPPTDEEFQRLLDACDALGAYGPQMRALIIFAAHTGMRPGELFELRWSDIDLARNRILVARRLYRGHVDVPKSGEPKQIALTPPARDVLMRQPTRSLDLVFASKTGVRLTAPTLSQYWAIVRAGAGLDASFDFYRCTKHFAVHNLYRLGLSRQAIAAQCGWSERSVDGLLRIYGHTDLVALREVDALYAQLRDASVTQEAPDGA